MQDKPSTILSAWLHLSNQCNFSCSYCYLHLSKDKMSLETGLQSVRAIFKSAHTNDISKVILKYAGGEAVFNFAVLIAMQKEAILLSKEFNMNLSSTVLSNGTTITDEIIKQLQGNQIKVAIGFDGLNKYQNIHRKYKNGKGSYADVIKTLSKLKTANLLSDIAITVTDSNVENLPEFVDFLLTNDYPFNISFYLDNDKASKNEIKLSEDKIIFYMRKAYKIIEKYLPNKSYLSALLDNIDLSVAHQYTCSMGKNYAVIDTKGQLSKCQMDVGQNKTFGNVWQEDIMQIIQQDGTQLTPISVNEKPECTDCEIKYYCAGGCPRMAARSGNKKHKSLYCNIYKALYKDVLRLEALRILKYEQAYALVSSI